MKRDKVLHYEIIEQIGKGGMGEVYRARDTRLDRDVALKFVPADVCPDGIMRERLISEARTASRLIHPNIVATHAIEHVDGEDFIVMEYVKGRPLSHLIADGSLELDQIFTLICEIAGGLLAAHHEGIVHRDIKSDNIMITQDGRAKILDFGLARTREATRVTRDDHTVGTVRYMSPEQALGKDIDHRSDVWAIGVCLYEMVAGRPPFDSDKDNAVLYQIINEDFTPVTELRSDAPAELDFVLAKALAKDRSERFADAGELCAAMESVRLARRGKSATMPAGETGPSIAVLPFTNMSTDPEQEFFCEGIAEDIINDLFHIDGLRVVSRSSSFSFKGKHEDIRSVGRKLGATSVLEGSVRKAGNRIRVTAQLVNVADGFHAWSNRYDRELQDVFSIQAEIAKSIAEALEIKLSDYVQRRVEKAATQDLEAYEFYLRGRRFLHRLYGGKWTSAIDMFQQAIARDPGYALAYCGLADTHSIVYMYYNSSEEVLVEAMSASARALELDHDLAEAHSARALAVSLNNNFTEAEAEFEKAIEMNPGLYEAYYYYGRTCHVQGKHGKACELFEKAHEVNPDDYQALALLSQACHQIGDYEGEREANLKCARIIERHVQREPGDSRAWGMGAMVFASLGKKDRALEWAQRAASIVGDDPAAVYNFACLYGRLRMKEKALDELERAISLGYAHRDWIDHDPDFDCVRDDPRFAAILAKIR